MTDTPSLEQLERNIRNSANWCYWIAALTAINAVAAMFGSEIGFALGSMCAMVALQLAAEASSLAKAAALAFNLLAIGYFVLMGFFANKLHRWAFGLAFGVYLADSLISLMAPKLISIGLHVWALYALGTGFRGVNELRKRRAAVLDILPPIPATATASGAVPPLLPPPGQRESRTHAP